MKKKKGDLDSAKTWKELRGVAENRGLKYKRTSGGHAIHGNSKGSMPFSTHEKAPSKGLLHSIKKQIVFLTGAFSLFYIFTHLV